MTPAIKASRLATIKFLTADEIRRLFAVIKSTRDRAMFMVAYRHGLRASEVGQLRVADLDLRKLRIMVHRVKGSLPGEHPLQTDEAKALRSWLKVRDTESPALFTSVRGTPISRRGLDFLMKQYSQLAKLPTEKQHFHVLKHSVATHLLDANADIRFVQDWLGHASIQNTLIYAYLTSRTRNEKARTFFQKMPKL